MAAEAYLEIPLGGMTTQIFPLIQAQNIQVQFLLIFKSDESLIFLVFSNVMPDTLRIDFGVVLF
jgi:hypothetical protein